MKITGILIKDKDSDTVTAYIKQLPGIVVEGDNIDDAKGKLQNAFHKFLIYSNGSIDDYREIELTFKAK